jgi:DNA modification methylase
VNRVIFQGDVLEKLAEMDKASIDCIISSPPYWGLRDYGISGQLGLEPDFRDYLKTMNDIMVQLKRVLKNTGTCWINLGDTYNSSGSSSDHPRHWDGREKNIDGGIKQTTNSLQTKSRMGIPERFYINCIDDGWIARNHIPWYKANSMPSSVKDRFTNKWESIFFFAKQQKYYFDLDSVREKTSTESKPFNVRVRDSPKGKYGSLFSATKEEITNHNSKGERKTLQSGYNNSTSQSVNKKHSGNYDMETGECLNNPKGKNPGDVFFINPKPFPEAHFATFPVDLPTKILKCACPKDGIVLDPFLGSGTVGIAAEQLGLKWCGIELNEEYITLARKRLDPFRNDSLEMFT